MNICLSLLGTECMISSKSKLVSILSHKLLVTITSHCKGEVKVAKSNSVNRHKISQRMEVSE